MTNDTTSDAATASAVTPHWHRGNDNSGRIFSVVQAWQDEHIQSYVERGFGTLCDDDACMLRVDLFFGDYDEDEFAATEERGPHIRFLLTAREQRATVEQRWLIEATSPEAADELFARSDDNGTLVDLLITDSSATDVVAVTRVPDEAVDLPGEMPISRYGLLRAAAAAVCAHTDDRVVAQWAIEALDLVISGDHASAKHLLQAHGLGALL